nr:MAG TPA: hypothetical protein [Caudoviricetes sp.]
MSSSSLPKPPIEIISLYHLDDISLLFRCIVASELCLIKHKPVGDIPYWLYSFL